MTKRSHAAAKRCVFARLVVSGVLVVACVRGDKEENPRPEITSWQGAVSAQNESGSNISGLNVAGANISGANIGGANVSGSNIAGANLTAANLSAANLSGLNLSGVNLGVVAPNILPLFGPFNPQVVPVSGAA